LFTVYALYSVNHDKIYIGFTSNLTARLAAHHAERGKGFTHAYRPWKVVHTEHFESKAEAQKREKQLKSSRGRTFIRDIIKSSFP